MSPSAKFNGLLASAVVTLMYFLAIYVMPRLNTLALDYRLVLLLGALVSSAGLYRILSLGLRWLMERCEWLKRMVLGPYYMHGTWIGWFHGHANDRRFMIEHFVQDLEGLVITGRSFTDAGTEHGYWESESTTIDAKKGRLIFTYKFDVITRKHSLVGIHSSLFERKSAHRPASALSGFAHDLNDDVRIAVHSQKISSALLPWAEALRIAETRYGNKAA
jgi:hypothetical protein